MRRGLESAAANPRTGNGSAYRPALEWREEEVEEKEVKEEEGEVVAEGKDRKVRVELEYPGIGGIVRRAMNSREGVVGC